MKYRAFTKEELETFKEDFIKFLSANTITGEDWKKIKAEKPNEAEELLNMFSDIVWEKSLSKIRYLEHSSEKDLKVFRYGEEKVEMVAFKVSSEKAPSLLEESTFAKLADGSLQLSDLAPEFYTSEKGYTDAREMELFKMMEEGCRPTSEQFYYGIKSLLKK
jgi:hypothetical protein